MINIIIITHLILDLNRIFVRFEEVYYEEVNQLKQNGIYLYLKNIFLFNMYINNDSVLILKILNKKSKLLN